MNKTPQQRALDILEAALDLPDDERDRVLREAAEADPDAGAELRRLDLAITRSRTLLRTDVGPQSVDEGPVAPPTRVGRFRIERPIGRGGMGTVYAATRDDGLFEQKVAIKLMARRRWNADLEQRFVAERQILARLEHRNIGRLYDGGTTDDGKPYIVMEYIDGLPITEYASAQRLDLRRRIQLFGQLCSALQFAHQQLVVHADIKPSNVLVTADGSVKLVDFGISHLLNADLAIATGPSAATGGTREPLTVAYAAPERRNGAPPSVAADVFSLGLLLRELLRGTANDAARVPPDLLAVTERATDTRPERRYGSVSELWDELSRWLRYLPIRAYGGSWLYQLRLFAVRNRTAVVLGAIAAVGLLGATIVSLRLYFEAEAARVAERARVEDLRELNSFLVNDLSEQMVNRPGMIASHWQALYQTLVRLERLAADNPGDVGLQIDLGRNVARIAYQVFVTAARDAIDARSTQRKLQATADRLEALRAQVEDRLDYWTVRAELAHAQAIGALQLDGDSKAMERAVQAALGHSMRARALDSASQSALAAWLTSRHMVAAVMNANGEQQQAIEHLDQTLAAPELQLAVEQMSVPLRRAFADATHLRCDIARWARNDASAFSLCEDVEKQLRRFIELEGPLVVHESRLAYTLFLQSTMLLGWQRASEAIGKLDEARALQDRILHFGGNDWLEGQQLLVQAARAEALSLLEKHVGARDAARSVLDLRRGRLAAEPASVARRREVAIALRRLGEIEERAANTRVACSMYGEAAGFWDQLERDGKLLGFDLAQPSGQVPWIRAALGRCR